MHTTTLTFEHLQLIKDHIQESQKDWANSVNIRDFQQLICDGYTILDDNNIPIFIGGAVNIWNRRSVCWCLIHQDAGKHFVYIIRAIKRFLTMQTGRVEAYVECDFSAGHKLMQVLDFTKEATRMKGFLENGKDASMYSIYIA